MIGWIIFFGVSTFIVVALHYVLWIQMVKRPRWPQKFEWLGSLLLIALVLGVPVSRIFYRFFPWAPLGWLAKVSLTWLGFLLLMITFNLILETLLLVYQKGRVLFGLQRRRLQRQMGESRIQSEERRVFMSRAAAATTAVAAAVVGTKGIFNALADPLIKHIQVPLPKLPQGLHGFKIVQITDLHIGNSIKKDYVQRVVRMANSLKPDFMALTGDFVDGPVEQLREDVAPLADLKSKWGSYFITGNHDYYSGHEEWNAHFRSMGIKVLENEMVVIGEPPNTFELVGIDWHQRFRIAMAQHNPESACVVLNHQPKGIDDAIRLGGGLQISGHTHGGQIWPFHLFVALAQPYVSGFHKHGNGYIYVSCGTGYWGAAMRVGAPSEITLIELIHT